MKIAILGTSNSVLGQNGYVQALRLHHQVVNLSVGRAPIYMHILTLLEQRELLESQDLVILDHYVNDAIFYDEHTGPDYARHRAMFFDLLAGLNTRVVNLLFPLRNPSPQYRASLKASQDLAQAHGIACVDLNALEFRPHHFNDRLHLAPDVSYLLGLWLHQLIMGGAFGDRPQGGAVTRHPFRVLHPHDAVAPDKVRSFANSLMSREYFALETPLTLPARTTERLVALTYLRPKQIAGASGLIINGTARGLGDIGFFVEALDLQVQGEVHLAPLARDAAPCPDMMGRKQSQGPFAACYLGVCLFVDEAGDLVATPARRPLMRLDLSGLVEAATRLVPAPPAQAGPEPQAEIASTPPATRPGVLTRLRATLGR